MHGCGKDCENVIQPTPYPPYLSLHTDTYALWAECERHLMRRPTGRTVLFNGQITNLNTKRRGR